MVKVTKKKVKTYLGLLIIASGLLIAFFNYQGSLDTSASFENEPVKIELAKYDDEIQPPLPVRIVITDLDIDLEVIKSNIVEGYWEVPEDTAAWGDGSGYPGSDGNQVIFAHAKEGLFLNLQDATEGMRIYVLTNDNWHEYYVDGLKEVYPNQVEVVAPTDFERLTLYTCSGYKDSKRLIITASP